MRTALVSLCIAIVFSIAAVHRAAPQSNNLEDKLDSLFQPLTSTSDPGFAVIVKQHGKILFEKGYGARELRSHAKIDVGTNFRLASVTKQFTAMAIMLLVHDGKLHYDDHLTAIFPEFPAYGKSITIRHLLTHTSGLPEYEDLMDEQEKTKGPIWSPERQIQDAEVLSLLEQQSMAKFTPGTSWSYSNSGYVVLGLVVAKVSGMPYGEFLQKHLFWPAGMNHTVVYQKGINEVSERAFGHSKEAANFKEADQSSTSATLGDGGIYSNVEDMGKWDAALASHSLLGEKEMAAALTAVKLANGSSTYWPQETTQGASEASKPVSYGFGWFLDPWQGHARMWHTGGTRGFRTVIERFTSDHLTVVLLCNRLDLEPESLAEKAAGIILASSVSQ